MHCPQPAAHPRRPAIEVADIFRAHGPRYREHHALTGDQLRVMRDIEVCRTEVLGGHLEVCTSCGYSRPAYNSCRNRHCPKCQSLEQARWLEGRMQRLLPVHYFHVVFTLPSELRPLCRRNPERLYNLLFQCASQTLLQLAADPDRLGAQLGITAVLHTWTRELSYHPHLHCIVTGGGLALDGSRWIPAQGKFLFPIHVLGALFRGKFLAALKRAHQDDPFRLDDIDFAGLLDTLYRIKWLVDARPPFGGPEHVFKYLGRYTHRVGVSNQRLISLDPRGVTFATKNGRTITLAPEEFIRRFLLHVLPARFVKKRHYGLWAAGNLHTRLPIARHRLLAGADAPPPAAAPTSAPLDRLPWTDLLRALTGIDVVLCPHCRTGRLVRVPLPMTSATALVMRPNTS